MLRDEWVDKVKLWDYGGVELTILSGFEMWHVKTEKRDIASINNPINIPVYYNLDSHLNDSVLSSNYTLVFNKIKGNLLRKDNHQSIVEIIQLMSYVKLKYGLYTE